MDINDFKEFLKNKSKDELVNMILSTNKNMNENKEFDKSLNLGLGVIKIIKIIEDDKLLSDDIILNLLKKFDEENKTNILTIYNRMEDILES